MVNIAAKVWAQAEDRPTKQAVRSTRGTLTYKGLRDRSGHVATAIRNSGVAPLDRVVLIAPTIPEFPIAYYGIHAAGATVITMNTMATQAEISYVLADSGASLVLAWWENAGPARRAAEANNVPCWEIADAAMFDSVRPLAEPHQHHANDTCLILYTSGTTGRPKGAELTAGNVEAASTMLLENIGITPDDAIATALPLFHVYGQTTVMNAALANGGSISLLSPFNAVELLDTIARDRITMVAGVPTMWNAMLQAVHNGADADFSRLRFASSGGAALPLEVLREFQTRFGCELLEGYGMTETTAIITTNDGNRVKRLGTVGQAAPGMSVELRDDANNPVEPGIVGEIYASGPTIMKGYWNRPDATAETVVDGWLRTGDLGTMDEDGYIRIVDRAKDLIIRGGYNVYPREVEEVLYEHPDIVEVAVVGVPDDHFGEEVAAAIVLRPESQLAGEAIRTWAKEQLSAYKVPRLFRFMDALPKGATGKILKRDIDTDSFLPSPARRLGGVLD